MIVYVESNFILEIAFEQVVYNDKKEEIQSWKFAEKILCLAIKKHIELVYPTLALSEPFNTLKYRKTTAESAIKDLYEKLQKQFTRTSRLKELNVKKDEVLNTISKTYEQNYSKLIKTVLRITKYGNQIDVTNSIINKALKLEFFDDRDRNDSIIFQSILSHLEDCEKNGRHNESKYFMSTNSKDFDKFESQRNYLLKYNCQYKDNFINCYYTIKKELENKGFIKNY